MAQWHNSLKALPVVGLLVPPLCHWLESRWHNLAGLAPCATDPPVKVAPMWHSETLVWRGFAELVPPCHLCHHCFVSICRLAGMESEAK